MAVPGTPLAAWTFRPASAFNVSGADYDEYLTTVTLPNQPGTTLRYLYRFSLDDGQHWTYCDTNGTGSDNGLSFDFSQPAASGGPGGRPHRPVAPRPGVLC
jgi:hypothetical protein